MQNEVIKGPVADDLQILTRVMQHPLAQCHYLLLRRPAIVCPAKLTLSREKMTINQFNYFSGFANRSPFLYVQLSYNNPDIIKRKNMTCKKLARAS